MANAKNIQGQGFHTDPARINKHGRPKGSLNRSKIARYWLDQIMTEVNPLTGQSEELSVADILILALITKGRKGDVAAIKELLDSAFGANKQVVESSHEVTTKDIIARAFPDPDQIANGTKSGHN